MKVQCVINVKNDKNILFTKFLVFQRSKQPAARWLVGNLNRALWLVESRHVGPEYKQVPILRNGETICFPKIMAQRWQQINGR